jgi:hypothetical protein
MANEYLIEIHNYISEKTLGAQNRKDEAKANNLLDIYKLIDHRIEDAKTILEHRSGNRNEKKYQEGRIKALMDFKDFLIQNFTPKLPRRIREDFELKN